MTRRSLVVIDVQKGFINEFTRHAPAAVERLAAGYGSVAVTRFYNAEGFFHRKLIGWHRMGRKSDGFALAFTPPAGAPVFDKSGYGAFTAAGFRAWLDAQAPDEVHLAGIATDNCILKTAVDLFDAGIAPVVLAHACASHGGPEYHDCGLRLLRRFIGEGQVIAAP